MSETSIGPACSVKFPLRPGMSRKDTTLPRFVKNERSQLLNPPKPFYPALPKKMRAASTGIKTKSSTISPAKLPSG